MTVSTLTTVACTTARHGQLITTPAGVVGGLTRDGWWSPPVSHHLPRETSSAVVIDRWLADSCSFTSDTGWDRGHHWKVTLEETSSVIPLPRRGDWRLATAEDLQAMASRTASLAVRGVRRGGPALAPSWTWWLWALGWVQLPVADALGVLEYATAHDGGLPQPQEKATFRPI